MNNTTRIAELAFIAALSALALSLAAIVLAIVL